jgi:hypothetical protein
MSLICSGRHGVRCNQQWVCGVACGLGTCRDLGLQFDTPKADLKKYSDTYFRRVVLQFKPLTLLFFSGCHVPNADPSRDSECCEHAPPYSAKIRKGEGSSLDKHACKGERSQSFSSWGPSAVYVLLLRRRQSRPP